MPPQGQADWDKPAHSPRREGGNTDRGRPRNDEFRGERAQERHGKPPGDGGSRFGADPNFKKKKRHPDKPAYAGHKQPAGASHAKPAFGKKAKEKRRG